MEPADGSRELTLIITSDRGLCGAYNSAAIKQTEQRMRSGWPMPWGASEFGSRREDKAFVLLPHCMQTSKSFWKRMGFGIGEEVDRKEHKQAVLLSRDDLPPKPRWLYEYRTAGAA